MIFSNHVRKIDAKKLLEEPSGQQTFAPTSSSSNRNTITRRPSPRATLNPNPAHMPTIGPTDNSFLTSKITAGGLYTRVDARTIYFINASTAVVIDGPGDNGGDVFTLIPNNFQSSLTIRDFNNVTDRVDVSYFDHIDDISQLNMTIVRNSLRITLEKQLIVLQNIHQISHLTANNFDFTIDDDYFTNEISGKKIDRWNNTSAIAIGCVMSVLLLVFFFTIHRSRKHRKKKVTIVMPFNDMPPVFKPPPVVTYTPSDMEGIQKINKEYMKNGSRMSKSFTKSLSGRSMGMSDEEDGLGDDDFYDCCNDSSAMSRDWEERCEARRAVQSKPQARSSPDHKQPSRIVAVNNSAYQNRTEIHIDLESNASVNVHNGSQNSCDSSHSEDSEYVESYSYKKRPAELTTSSHSSSTLYSASRGLRSGSTVV